MTTQTQLCPKCYYDLSGTPVKNSQATCPECGENIKPSHRTTQSLKHPFKTAVALIALPSVAIPIASLLTLQFFSWQTAQKIVGLYLGVSIIAPVILIPVAYLIAIRYPKQPELKKDIAAIITILLCVTGISAVAYIMLTMFIALMYSGL